MSATASQSRHDAADLRRLHEFGYEPVQWRRPPAAVVRKLIVLAESAPEKGLLADLLRALRLTGHALTLHSPSTPLPASKGLILRFGDAAVDETASSLTLPALSELRGNPVAKRAAWEVLRVALR